MYTTFLTSKFQIFSVIQRMPILFQLTDFIRGSYVLENLAYLLEMSGQVFS